MRDAVWSEPVSARFSREHGKVVGKTRKIVIFALGRQDKAMNFPNNEVAFPQTLPWEEFTERRVTIDELRKRLASTLPTLMLAHLADEQSPMLDRSAVAGVVQTTAVGLDADAHQRLVRDLVAIGSWYLLPAARTVADADIDATRKYLAYLSRHGRPAFKALDHILSLLPTQIEDAVSADERSSARLGALSVKAFLVDIERLLPQLNELIGVKKAGRPPNFTLNHSARLAATAVEEAGLVLRAHGHSVANPLPYLTGSGAPAFFAFFRLLAPRVQPATLVRSLLNAKLRTNNNSAKPRTIDVGAPGG